MSDHLADPPKPAGQVTAAMILGLPGHQRDIDPVLRPLQKLLWHYSLREMMPCGLKGRHPHKTGVVVRLVDGGITNLGHDCGKKEFGAAYDNAAGHYVADVLRPRLQLGREAVQLSQPSLRALLTRAVAAGNERRDFNEAFPQLTRRLKERSASNNGDRIYKPRERTEQEIENLLALNPRSRRDEVRYEQVQIGVIDGLAAWSGGERVNLAKLETDAVQFLQMPLANASFETMSTWASWLDAFAANLSRADQQVITNERFFARQNVRKLALITDDEKLQAALATWGDRSSTTSLDEPLELPKGWSGKKPRRRR